MFFDYQFPILGCFFLFFAMILYWISFYFPKNSVLFQICTCLVIGSNFTFALTLLMRWIEEKYFPLSNLYESLIFLSWGISTIHLFLEFQTKSKIIGAIASPIVFFLSGFSSLTLPIEMQKALPLVPSLQSNWLMMHVTMMMISYATLIIGSLLSLLYLAFFSFSKRKEKRKEKNLEIQNFSISSSSSIETSSLPLPYSNFSLLQTVDLWSYRIIGLGFPFLTIGIISGAVWANEAWGSYWSWDPKETWALITWLVFAIYLHSRLLKGWQGKQAAILGSCGFFVIWICYLGVNFLGKGLHSYGWVL
uniref:Cytochrome c biogenesis protein CcsA n=1 Tax=Mallomonas splendens TaxID=52552 RepID=A0A3G2QZQ2_9STRA|nr:cytochrome c biogenesis protein [Mallomonas splendens]AYO28616.1 cytochrome c biogenesis protein [Mallomonas splendens]